MICLKIDSCLWAAFPETYWTLVSYPIYLSTIWGFKKLQDWFLPVCLLPHAAISTSAVFRGLGAENEFQRPRLRRDLECSEYAVSHTKFPTVTSQTRRDSLVWGVWKKMNRKKELVDRL